MAVFQVDPSKRDFSIYKNLLLVAAIAVGIAAQVALSTGTVALAVLGYAAACGCAIVGVLPTRVECWGEHGRAGQFPAPWRLALTAAAIICGAGTFALCGGNIYRPAGVVLWVASMVCWWLAFMHTSNRSPGNASAFEIRGQTGSKPSWIKRLTPVLLLIGILALGLAFRYLNLYSNPLDMNSDQAEKLLDIRDVINGTPHIFFERNTGREPWQFYWTVLLIKLFDLPQNFMALKLGTSFIGWLMLPAIFLLAREVFDIRTALIATLFAAVASWGVITARYGLRYPLAPCAVAWTMYFLVRGLRRNERNSMLAAGVWSGIGMQGYTAYRFMALVAPLVVLAWVGWAWLHGRRELARSSFVDGLLALVMAVLVMMPLLRYGYDKPDMLFFRAATRLSSTEQPIKGNPVSIIVNNVKNVLLMFNSTHDEVWVANLPDRPAMDDVLAALLVIGVTGSATLSVRNRSIWPVLVLGSGVLMLLPSALSIAFPRENPSVVRTGGAIPMLMIVCAVVPGNLLAHQRFDGSSLIRPVIAWVTVIAVCAAVIGVNYQRVFVDYPAQYCPLAQNASDIAHEMDAWVNASPDNQRSNAWIIGYPYWVDSRAVGIWIGDITFPNTAGSSVDLRDAAAIDPRGQPGWFVLNEQDNESLQALKMKYPSGQAKLVLGSQCTEKHFITFTTN
jgi:hypothetical protein